MSRHKLLGLIAELSERYPEMRLGQLACNLASWAPDEPSVWDANDDELITAAESHLSQRESDFPAPKGQSHVAGGAAPGLAN